MAGEKSVADVPMTDNGRAGGVGKGQAIGALLLLCVGDVTWRGGTQLLHARGRRVGVWVQREWVSE